MLMQLSGNHDYDRAGDRNILIAAVHFEFALQLWRQSDV